MHTQSESNRPFEVSKPGAIPDIISKKMYLYLEGSHDVMHSALTFPNRCCIVNPAGMDQYSN